MKAILHVRLVALVLVACTRSHTPAPPPAPPDASSAVQFVEDDYPRALAEARRRGVPLFVDAWAPWCHTCLSMRAFVFPDEALAPIAGRYEWLALDTERDANAAIVQRLGVKVLPTLYVIDPRDERVELSWPGSLTAKELLGLLADTEGGSGPRGPLAVDATVTRANREGRLADCASTASREAPRMPPGTALADVLDTGIECAEGLPKDSIERAGLVDLATLGERVASDPSQPILADDRSDLYDHVQGAYLELGRGGDRSRVAQAWVSFLDGEAAHATGPQARAVFDSHRLLAYQAVGAPERAVPVLQQSERDFPDDYNPSARLASAYLSMKRYDDALDALNRAFARAYGPRKLRLWSLKADILEAAGDSAGASAALREALEFARSVPLPESYPKQVDAIAARLARYPMSDAGPDAGPPPPPARPRKGIGAACRSVAECGLGLSCCQTGFHGHCGGVVPTAAEQAADPCIFTASCARAPCVPLSLPP